MFIILAILYLFLCADQLFVLSSAVLLTQMFVAIVSFFHVYYLTST
jgi:hypothetical protein